MSTLLEHTRLLQSQENVPCCTASSILTSVEIICNLNNINYNFSRLFLYYNTRKLQGRVLQKGANLIFTFDALNQFGCCEEKYWPFLYKRVDKEPSQSAYLQAEKFKPIRYTVLYDTDFKKYIDQNFPIVIGMNIGRQFLKLKGDLKSQTYYPINNDTNRYSRGHALTIVGYDDNICGGSWIVANSAGLKWGDKGFGIVPYSCEVDIGEAYVIQSFQDLEPRKKISDN